MYTFSSKLKTFSLVLMVLGLLGIGYGFISAPKDIQAVEAILASSEHGSHHEAEAAHAPAEEAHAVNEEHAAEEAQPSKEISHDTVKAEASAEETHAAVAANDSVEPAVTAEPVHASTEAHAVESVEHGADAHAEHQAHLEHVLHQLQNKPWAALYVACIFFMLVSLGVLAFYAIQQVAQSGWSPVLFRVMQGITAYLPVGSIIFFVILVATGLHIFHSNHLFVWLGEGVTDPKSPNYDEIIAGKSGYLNFPFWIVRALVFLAGWNLYRYFSRKNCLAQDEAHDDLFYKKNFKISAGFLVFFIVTESIMSWDWIMSVDPHWFSTLFAWYVFASFLVSGVTVICLISLYLKTKGYLEYVNTSHIHDLAKFMFGFSVFWTYLWFSQFMLIWYANIPEEVTYFVTRIQEYNLPFFGAVVMNFLFPVLILINTDFKRISWILVMAGVVILFGHYIDFFNMIMPGTVGDQWFIGVSEISSVLFFFGLFIYVVFTALTKAPLLAKRNPFIEESKHFHY